MSTANRPAIFIMESLRFGVMKSEIRNPKSERIPKSKIRSSSSHWPRAAVGRCLRGLPGRYRGWLTRQPIDMGFGLRTSGFLRHSGFGIRIYAIACFSETFDLWRLIPK